MRTKELIFSMLTENTGTHMLDSGGAYGRNWERNQSKTIEDFENEPEEIYTWDGYDVRRTVSVFHYLSQLEQDEICEEFNAMPCEDWDAEGNVYGVSDKQWKWLNWQANDDLMVISTFNTYNGNSDLSQVLQGSWLELNGEQYLLLQVHGGCDVRGGYTDAKLFKPREEYFIHEYLHEYVDSYDLNQLLEEGIITVVDESDHSIEYTCEEMLEKLNVSSKTH